MFFDPAAVVVKTSESTDPSRYYLGTADRDRFLELPLVWHPYLKHGGPPRRIKGNLQSESALGILLRLDVLCRLSNIDLIKEYESGKRAKSLFKVNTTNADVVMLKKNPSLQKMVYSLAKSLHMLYIQDYLEKCADEQ
uniref:OB_NTP_bind domain-containing protein n=1 Tax=Panagrellus redivivus TaxID=6233 RepID=A0A7E4VGX3_PANRE